MELPLTTVRLTRGDKSVRVALDDLKARKLSPVFQLQASSIYLVNEFDIVAVFPNEQSGHFNGALIDMSAIYNVHGDEMSSADTRPSPSQTPGAFGAYTGPTAPDLLSPNTSAGLVSHKRKKSFSKTIALVSLSSPDPNKASTSKAFFHLDYTVVTQVVVSIEAGSCSPSSVAEKVSQQVGFEIVLLDSKCIPILENDKTASIDFWKYNRKILAASKSLYTKLTGSSVNPRRATSELHDAENDDDIPAKRCCLSERKLDKILRGVEAIINTNKISSACSNAFECIICKDAMKDPQFSPCCKRIVGCRECVACWREESHTCPHCSSSNIVAGYADVHCLEEVITSLGKQVSIPWNTKEQDSDSDFDLAVVKFRDIHTRTRSN